MPTKRPTLAPFLDAHPHDPEAALDAYRAAVHRHRALRPVMAMAIGAVVIAVLLAIVAALGCSSTDRHCRDRCVEACEGAEEQPAGETGGKR